MNIMGFIFNEMGYDIMGCSPCVLTFNVEWTNSEFMVI